MKDYSPKRQYFLYSFSIHYGVKLKNLTTFKTVAIETLMQHSIYDIIFIISVTRVTVNITRIGNWAPSF